MTVKYELVTDGEKWAVKRTQTWLWGRIQSVQWHYPLRDEWRSMPSNRRSAFVYEEDRARQVMRRYTA